MRIQAGPRSAPRSAEPSADAGPLRTWFGLGLIGLLVLAAASLGVLVPIDDGLAHLRFTVLSRPASHTLTTVDIDAASIRAAGHWPWGRERFAQVINNLQAAGAKQIAFDVDFSASSATSGDQLLRQAIDARPSTVILPSFVQRDAHVKGGLAESRPLESISNEALIASVNVPVDPDGRVRRYRYGFGQGETYRPSVGAMLAETPAARSGAFLIDYGIRVGTLDHLSFQDVYLGRFDKRLVRGRTILVGSTALELGDEFAAPITGTIAGVNLHGLAYESLRSGRALIPAPRSVTLGLALLAAALLRPTRRRLKSGSLIAIHVAAFVAAVGLPVVVQALAPLSIDTGAVLLAQVFALVWAIQVELQRRADDIIREREAGLLHLAMHESETMLPNRRALVADIAASLESDGTQGVAVVAIGIDRFAAVRAAIGYGLFTQVMLAVAERAGASCGVERVAHLSTSVLGLVLRAPTAEGLRSLLGRIEAMAPTYAVGGIGVDAFHRIGVAFRRQADDTAEQLLESASIALDRAREQDRKVVIFDRREFTDPSFNLGLMSEMLRGLQAGEMALHYQPQRASSDGVIRSVESLLRWTHPRRGAIPPDSFIATAEETGMIRALTEWTIERAIADSRRLAAEGREVVIAINISGRLLTNLSFRRWAIKRLGEDAPRFCFEITESALIGSPDLAVEAIADYRAAGLKVSIDDYGTGLASLAYLKMIDADELKIDKSLVASVGSSQRDRLILKSTIDLAHGLGMTVVAEGVETEDVDRAIRALGCDLVQGYLVSRPVSLEQLTTLLASSAAQPPRLQVVG